MEKIDQETRDLFARLVPKIVKNNTNLRDKKIEYDITIPNGPWFLSCMYFLNIKLKEEEQVIKLVVKFPPKDDIVRQVMKSDSQFHNEILFYRTIEDNEKFHYARCYYHEENLPNDSILVLENLMERGYDVCPSKNDAPLNYIFAAMKELGRFHARNYIMKEKQPDRFVDIIKNIEPIRCMEKLDVYDKVSLFINQSALRPVNYLKKQSYDSKFCQQMENYFSRAYDDIFVGKMNQPGKLGVLSHGDFTSNNVMFKKLEESNEIDAKMIDLAMLCYVSPIIDLATFLFVSCSNATRKKHFKQIFQTYHRSLSEHLKRAGILDEDKYSFQAFIDEYKREAVFGLVIATFFLPKLLGLDTIPIDETLKLEPEVAVERSIQAGGDELSRYFADMLLELKDHGALYNISNSEIV